MFRRLLGGKSTSPQEPPAGNMIPEAARRPMTDKPADARHARPKQWMAYLDARAASLQALRVGDVTTAAKRAEDSRRLHAAWRGYDYAPGPSIRSTTLQVPEPQLVGLSDPTSVQVELAMSIIGPTIAAPDHAKRLIGLTITDDLSWPWLEEWRGWFAERRATPPMWDDALLVGEPARNQVDDHFREQLRSLGVDGRIAVAYGGHAVEIDLLAEDLCLTVGNTRALASTLATGGLALYPASAAGRLARALTVAQLKALAESKGIPVKGKKESIVAALVGQVGPAELDRLAPGEFVELAGPPATRWMAYRRAFIIVWAHTMTMSGFGQREMRDAVANRDILKGFTIMGDDDCSYCRTRNREKIALRDLTPQRLPPFHPGCRCASAPWVDWD